MILVDTSVWVEHLRGGDEQLAALLDDGDVLMHPFVIGELACGNLRNAGEILELLAELPKPRSATDDEVLQFIALRGLRGRGIGYIDMHLLAAAALSPGTRLLTYDKRLAA